MSVQARLYKFLIDMKRVNVNDIPEPYKSELFPNEAD